MLFSLSQITSRPLQCAGAVSFGGLAGGALFLSGALVLSKAALVAAALALIIFAVGALYRADSGASIEKGSTPLPLVALKNRDFLVKKYERLGDSKRKLPFIDQVLKVFPHFTYVIGDGRCGFVSIAMATYLEIKKNPDGQCASRVNGFIKDSQYQADLERSLKESCSVHQVFNDRTFNIAWSRLIVEVMQAKFPSDTDVFWMDASVFCTENQSKVQSLKKICFTEVTPSERSPAGVKNNRELNPDLALHLMKHLGLKIPLCSYANGSIKVSVPSEGSIENIKMDKLKSVSSDTAIVFVGNHYDIVTK